MSEETADEQPDIQPEEPIQAEPPATEEPEEDPRLREDVDSLSDLDEDELSPLQQELLEIENQLREEYDEDKLTEFVFDCAFTDEIATAFLDAKDRILQEAERRSGKARFYCHLEPNDEVYFLVSPMPREFNTSWIMTTNPQTDEELYSELLDQLLQATMLYPGFKEVDWNYEGGDKMYAPYGLTKENLKRTFWQYEFPDPQQPNSVPFGQEEIETASEVSERSVEDEKPGF